MSESDSEPEDKEIEWERRVAQMRERLKTRLDENTIEGKREDNLYHGMKLVSFTTMIGKLKEICYCDDTQEYLVIDYPSNMLRYSVAGKLIQPSYSLSANMLFTKLLWCQKAKVLIGYLPNDEIIWLMTSFCMIYQIFRNDFRVTAVFYEPSTNEAVVAGANKVTRFQLINKESTINPYKTMSYIDSEYGPLWKLECIALIPSSTSMLRMAGSYMTTIYVLPMETSKEKEDIVPIMFLARNPGATRAQITALLFQVVSQWIITGDEQGNVMGWNLDLNCTMNCPNGHSRCIKIIVPHPSICGFITCAEDNVLQIWSCNLRGKMESFLDVGEIWGIAVNESAAAIATLGQKLCCFNMHQLYTFYAALSESSTQIISTMNPMYSTRLIVRSSDNTIRILTSSTGKQTNLQILPNKNLNLVSMAYSGNRERLYTIILKTGEILVSNTRMNPMELKHVWVPNGSVITCITAYEYYEEVRGYDLKPQNPRVIYQKYTLIFVGTEDGAIVNIDESSGKHESRFSAHNGAVTKLWSSTISKLVVSVGVDKCVKVWRVFADLAIPLALSCSVYYTVPITHVVTMGSVMCMVSSTPENFVHQLFMYNMVETVRLDHYPSKDHTKLISDIAVSESLQICATSSMDNSIRIWDHQNVLIKILEINTCANNVAFSSLRGDIVFGAGRHLYKISYCNYLAPKYRARILVNEIPDEIEEESSSENKEYRIYDSEINRELLLHPVNSVPLGSLDIRNGGVPRMELMIQKQMCAQLELRDQDIENVRKGEIKAVKLVADKSIMNHEAWEKYIEDILSASKRPGTEIPPQNIWAKIDEYKNVKRFYNKTGVFKMFYGYSIEKFPEYPERVPDSVQHPWIPLFGFLPNSVIYKLFSEEDVELPPPMPEPKPLLKYEYPQEFMDQLRETDSSGFESNADISPSQLLNMTMIQNVESDTIVIRASIPEDQSPFVKMTRYVSQCGQNLKKKKHKVRRVNCGSVKIKRTGRTKTVIRKSKEIVCRLPSTMEKIIYETEGNLEMILSQKIANEISPDNLKCKGAGGNFEKKFCADISKKILGHDKAFVFSQEPKVSRSRELVTSKERKFIDKSSSLPRKNSGIAKKKRKLRREEDPKSVSKSDSISNETCYRSLGEKFTNIDDLAVMRIRHIISQKKSIKEILKQDYGSISTVHNDKIKNALMQLLARCKNTPSSFTAILNLLNVLPVDNIEIVGFLCSIFTVTSNKVIRKTVLKYLKNHGLRDPQKVLTAQLTVIRSLMNTSDIFLVKKFVSGVINDWMYKLERQVALVGENTKHSDDFECVKSFLRKGGVPEERVISPIEGINYFCELNNKLLRKF